MHFKEYIQTQVNKTEEHRKLLTGRLEPRLPVDPKSIDNLYYAMEPRLPCVKLSYPKVINNYGWGYGGC